MFFIFLEYTFNRPAPPYRFGTFVFGVGIRTLASQFSKSSPHPLSPVLIPIMVLCFGIEEIEQILIVNRSMEI